LINCAACREGIKLADMVIEEICDYLFTRDTGNNLPG